MTLVPCTPPLLRRLAGASLVALLAGCAVGPDFTAPKAPDVNGYTEDGIPKTEQPNAQEVQQSFTLGKKISGDWWQLFHSQRLNDVLRQAIAGNETIISARATLAQAQQAIAQAGGVLYPQIDFGAGFTRQQVSEGQFALPGKTPPFNLYSIGPTVSYSLDPFGGNRRRVEQEGALAEYAGYQLDAAYLTLTGNAATQALNIASAREQIKAVEQIITDDEQDLRLVQTELNAGEATQLDVQTQTSQLEADRALLPPIRQQLNAANHALSILLGRLPAQWVPPDFDLAEFTLPPELPVTLPSDLVRQRPDFLASEAQLHAASAAIGVATAQLYPNINLSASFSQEALSTSVLFQPESSVFSVGAQLLAPVFHGGALIAQKRAAVDAFDASLANYKQTVLIGFGQVADAMTALEHDAELLEAQRRALASAEESLRLTRTTYQYGNVGVLQVLEAQRLDEQARLGYVRAKAQRYLDTVQFLTAMGGGWWNWKDRAAPMEASTQAPAAAPVPVSTAAPAQH
ncbi:MAG TPA: efflux transporter outer membrane subunit [Stellaceae bacterium]|nr:efflux transporter outer membrane subunit [Stellaceae bacterium]